MGMKPNELRDSLKGIVHLVMTPFNDKNEVDVPALKGYLEKQVEMFKGEDVVFLIGGSTAEFYAMTDEEFKVCAKTCVEAVDGKFPTIVGTGRGGTDYTLEVSKFAQDIGADGAMVVNPYYHAPTIDGLYRHYEILGNELDIGIVIYNNPSTSSVWIDPASMVKMSKIPNVVGLKENIGCIKTLYRINKLIDPKDMAVFTGIGHDMYQYASLFGCKGFVSELLHFAPEIGFEIYKSGQEKDFIKMQALCEKVDPFFEMFGKCPSRRPGIPSTSSFMNIGAGTPFYQSIIKTAMDLVGLPGGKVREPMENLTSEEVDEMREILINIGCKVVK